MRLNYERGLQRLGKAAGIVFGGWIFIFCVVAGTIGAFDQDNEYSLYIGIGLIISGFVGAAGAFYLVRWVSSSLVWLIKGFIDTEDDDGCSGHGPDRMDSSS